MRCIYNARITYVIVTIFLYESAYQLDMVERVTTEMVNTSIRLDKKVKHDAEALFSDMGINMTTAVNIFLRRCLMENRIPFEVGLYKPNAETIAAIEELEAMRRGEKQERVMSLEEVFGKR